MYCISCGTELPKEANFCSKCGKSQNDAIDTDDPLGYFDFDSIPPPYASAEYEICDIVCSELSRWRGEFKFWARAIGTNYHETEPYNVGEVRFFTGIFKRGYPSSDNPRAVTALNELIQKLYRDRWRPQGWSVKPKTVKPWYSQRFERWVTR